MGVCLQNMRGKKNQFAWTNSGDNHTINLGQ